MTASTQSSEWGDTFLGGFDHLHWSPEEVLMGPERVGDAPIAPLLGLMAAQSDALFQVTRTLLGKDELAPHFPVLATLMAAGGRHRRAVAALCALNGVDVPERASATGTIAPDALPALIINPLSVFPVAGVHIAMSQGMPQNYQSAAAWSAKELSQAVGALSRIARALGPVPDGLDAIAATAVTETLARIKPHIVAENYARAEVSLRAMSTEALSWLTMEDAPILTFGAALQATFERGFQS